ncbi:MAG TPA: hypothetical protein VHA05_03035 [Candidatus Saccharimonadales bacterium]|nr:hypothetical protein [Candidatus Saccharimonadales bacterium]
MSSESKGQKVHGHIRTRLRSTCIEGCSNYPDLREEAEAAQDRVNAAIDAGQQVMGKSVKIICPYNPDIECPGFVYSPPLEDEPAGD